jgi:putative membrane protein
MGMTLRYLFASLHLIALAIGIAAVYGRWRALRRVKTASDLLPVFHNDNWYGIAVLLWLVTGLVRAFGGLEKGTDYYLHSHWFIGKMGLFLIVFLLEIYPMMTLIRWRRSLKRGGLVELGRTKVLARITLIELPLLVMMVFMATAMARGL